MSIYQDKIIFGKSPIERITSIEVKDDTLEIYREDEETLVLPHKYWVLSHEKLSKHAARMKGDLHFKWGYQFTDRKTFNRVRMAWKEKDIFSVYNATEGAMLKDGYTSFKGMKPSDLSVLSFDIETDGLFQHAGSRIFLISNTFRKHGKVVRKLFCYDEYENDGEMLTAWANWVVECNPSILLGHNIFGYDLPYMRHVGSKYGVTLDLGRNGEPLRFETFVSKKRKDSTQNIEYNKAHCYGREIIDTFFMTIDYSVGRNYESFALKKVIAHEKLEVEGRQHYDAAKIKDNYMIPEEWEKIKAYAIHDADDALALFDLMCPAYFYFAQQCPKSFSAINQSASGAQINSLLIRSYLQDAHSIPKATEKERYQGAISFGIKGVYRNVAKIDIRSEYPSVIRQYKIYDRDKDPKAHLLYIVDTLAEQRFEFKRLVQETGDKGYQDRDQASKLILNSIYGMLGAKGLNFNSSKCAELVTRAGRELIKFSIEWATGKRYEDWKEEVGYEESTVEEEIDDEPEQPAA